MGEWGEYDSKEGIQAGEVKLPPQQHQLQQTMPSKTELLSLEHEWVLWYDEGSPKGQSHADYENSMKRLGSFATIQDFWRYWNNIVDIAKFPDYSNLRMFKVGIKPMWEDRANIEGCAV
jgi:translation initiation factor 4E